MPKTKLEAGLYSDAFGRQAAVYHLRYLALYLLYHVPGTS